MSNDAVIIKRFIEEVLNRGDIDGSGRFIWEDVIVHAPLPGQGPGLAGIKAVLRDLRAAFPDIHWTVEEQLTDGGRVLTRFVWTGTHNGPFLGVPATGRQVRVWGMAVDRMVAGRIKETRVLVDMLGLMTQLGAIPGGESA